MRLHETDSRSAKEHMKLQSKRNRKLLLKKKAINKSGRLPRTPRGGILQKGV